MATLVFTDASVKVNTVDLSDHVKQVKLNYSAELQEATAMGNTSKARKGGLKDWSIEVEFYQDYAAAKVDATIFPLVGTQTAVELIPVKSVAVSATNPRYTGNGIVESYPPVAGGVGEMEMAPVTIQGSDGVALARATS
jgi:hypothetical protein